MSHTRRRKFALAATLSALALAAEQLDPLLPGDRVRRQRCDDDQRATEDHWRARCFGDRVRVLQDEAGQYFVVAQREQRVKTYEGAGR
jgi:hypothetical protein